MPIRRKNGRRVVTSRPQTRAQGRPSRASHTALAKPLAPTVVDLTSAGHELVRRKARHLAAQAVKEDARKGPADEKAAAHREERAARKALVRFTRMMGDQGPEHRAEVVLITRALARADGVVRFIKRLRPERKEYADLVADEFYAAMTDFGLTGKTAIQHAGKRAMYGAVEQMALELTAATGMQVLTLTKSMATGEGERVTATVTSFEGVFGIARAAGQAALREEGFMHDAEQRARAERASKPFDATSLLGTTSTSLLEADDEEDEDEPVPSSPPAGPRSDFPAPEAPAPPAARTDAAGRVVSHSAHIPPSAVNRGTAPPPPPTQRSLAAGGSDVASHPPAAPVRSHRPDYILGPPHAVPLPSYATPPTKDPRR